MPLLLLKYSDAMAPEARDRSVADVSQGVWKPDTEKMYQCIVEVFTETAQQLPNICDYSAVIFH